MSLDQLLLAAGTVQAVPFFDRLVPAREAGFAGISIFAADLEQLEQLGVSHREVRDRVADAGLFIHEVEIVGNWLAGEPTKANPGWLAALLQRSTPERLIDLAEALSARGVSVGELQGVAWAVDEGVEAFAAICDRAGPAGLHVALEYVPTGTIPDLATAWDLIRLAGRDNGGLLVDSWHQFRSGSSLDLLAALPAGAIKSVQICDAPATASDDLDSEMIQGRLLPGDGGLDLHGFVAALRATGTTAPCSVEVFSATLATCPVEDVARLCAEKANEILKGSTYG